MPQILWNLEKGGGGFLCLEEPATGPNSESGESSRKPPTAYL